MPLGVPKGGLSRLFALFDRQVGYFFNCQSTPARRAELDGACDQRSIPYGGCSGLGC